MAQTSIRIKTDIKDIYQRIVIQSQPNSIQGEHCLEVTVIHCNDKWDPVGESLQYVKLDQESDFHIELRKASAEKEQLITQFSTNPEWNPEGYILLDDQIKIKDPNDDPDLKKPTK